MARGYELLKQDELLPTSRRRSTGHRIAISVALVVSVVVLSILYAFPPNFVHSRPHLHPISTLNDGGLEQCPANDPPKASPPAKVNLWTSLTVDETASITKWISAPEQGLNITSFAQGKLSDNVIFHVDAFRPSKADALAYLNDPTSDNLPARFSRVTVHHGGLSEPVIRDYLVGPLPIGPKASIRQLAEIYNGHGGEIPFNARGFTNIEELTPVLAQYMIPLKHITEDLLGASALGLPNDTLVASANGPMSFDGGFRRTWVSWRRNVPAPWLHPLDFHQYLDCSGNDPSNWKVLKVVYNHQVFPSIEAFTEAYHDGTLIRPDTMPDAEEPSWGTRKRPGKQRDLDHLPGPRSVSFAGLRFRVDRALQYVSWMGWGLYLGFDRDMGLSLWDLRFRDERIIYELSPQEAIAQYAGMDPMQATTAWLDRYFGMGGSVRDMIPGYDCPDEAVYLPATTNSAEGSLTRSRAICIFEQDANRPITRHTGYHENEFGAVRGYILTIRSISTVGKYVFDYMFQIDGTIEVRVSASGYLQGGFWEADREPYGGAIRASTMGSLHDHVINFKVDLDVVGTDNSLLATTTAQEEIEQPWFDDDWGKTVIQQKITRTIIENEDDALLKYPVNFQGGYSIVNQAEKNRWGVSRGYAIHPGYSPVHNTVVGSKRLLNNANWARYNLAVSKRKETELMSSTMWNLHLPGVPVVDFHKFFDGENITQTDLVAWVNVGTHHLPQAEDSPNTRTNLAASSFFLTPLNYFDADVSMESTNAIILSSPASPGQPYTYEDYGVSPLHCIPHLVPKIEYTDPKAYGVDGREMPPGSMEELRKMSELFHRIKMEL
ncbi:amine oxidase catalytic domain-containing protein [Amylostereum chailletii]|nr:amine oxidase catalytic domain-containing protein [Amylostereum chailletii]